MREKYARGSKLGSGGFGEVYKSTLVATGQIFAQKILASAADPEDVERFKREVRLLKTLNHPRIIRVVDTQLRVPPYWYVMPLYAGNLSSNLSDVRAEERMRSKIVNQLLQAIGYAHDKGVIHRDLKPENVLLDTDGDIAVSDFGLGRRIDSASARNTYTGDGFGTPYYMAPEQQSDAKHADGRADIYAIGRIIYQLYTGDPPSAAQDLMKLPAELRQVVAKCTKHDARHRYNSVAELRSDYELASGALARRAARDDLVALLDSFIASAAVEEAVARLSRTLTLLIDEKDLVHDMVMRIIPHAFATYAAAHSGQARELIRRFAQHVIDSRWGYRYCDRIANRAELLFGVVSDAQIHAALLVMLLELGVANDRPHVLDTFVRLLGRISTPDDACVVCHALHSSRPRLEVIRARLEDQPMHPAIRAWIALPTAVMGISPLPTNRQQARSPLELPAKLNRGRRG